MRFLILILFTLLVSLSSKNTERNPHKRGDDNISEADFQHTTKKNIELVGYWLTPPNLIICDNVTTVSRVKQAIGFWEKMGYNFGEIKKFNQIDCLKIRKYQTNTIVIQLPTSQQGMTNKLALTNTHRNTVTNQHISSEIFIFPFACKKPLVLEHELGHALGWRHAKGKYHIMNRSVNMIGSSTVGVRYSSYKRNVAEQFGYFFP